MWDRYEIGRTETDRWRAWNENLIRIAENSANIVAANNRYDAEYIKYFTGLEDVPVIPSLCDYVKADYKVMLLFILYTTLQLS